MARWPAARWESCPNYSGTLNPIAVCLHHQAGNGDPLPIYLARGVSAHFWIPRSGQPVQHVDTGNQAWHGMTSHNQHSIGVETEGCANPPNADPLTENQLDQFAALMAWAHTTHGIPLVLSESTTTPGLNYHRCAGGPATGCPCDVRKNARAEILARAAGTSVGLPSPDSEETLMVLVRNPKGSVGLLDGSGKKLPVFDVESLAAYQAAGIKVANITDRDFNAIPNA